MGIVNTNDAAIAQAAAIQQAVQASLPAPVATITNAPVVLPATGAAPEPVAAAVVVEAPAIVQEAAQTPGEPLAGDVGGAVGSATDATQPTSTSEPLTKAQQLAAKIDALNKRIEADSKKREQLEAQLRSVDLLDSVKAGSVIVARVGRAETSKEVVASVVGVQTLESGDKRFKIYFGEGIEAELVVIQESQIIDIRQA